MKYFYKELELEVPNSVYYPREDSELLAEAIEKMNLKGKRCLDMGCGSGLLTIIMTKQGANATAADSNPEAVGETSRNAIKNKATIISINSDLFSNIKEKFDLIVFNPPYLPGEEKEKQEITYYGGKNGREVIEKFLAEAKNFLKRNGKILLLISTVTGEKEVWDLAMKNEYKIKEIARRKVPWEELIVLELGL